MENSLYGWMDFTAAYRSNSSTVEGFHVTDWDGDGKLDLLLCMQGPTVSNITFLNRALLPVNSIENGTLILSTSSVRQDTLCDMQPVDFDEDGVVDLFLGGFTRYFQRQSTDSDLIEQPNPLGIYNGSVLQVFDFDADGQLELLLDAFGPNDHMQVVFRWLRRALDGSFVESEDNPFEFVRLGNLGGKKNGIEKMYLTDWDADGLPDLVVVEFYEYHNHTSWISTSSDWYRQVRDRDMMYNSHFTAFEEIPLSSIDQISVLDWNQDGFDDHVDIDGQLYEISDAGARPVSGNPYQLTGIQSSSAYSFVDWDGDGDLDVLVANRSRRLEYWEQVDGKFHHAEDVDIRFQQMVVSLFAFVTKQAQILPVDWDQDGDVDLVLVESAAKEKQERYFERLPNGSLCEKQQHPLKGILHYKFGLGTEPSRALFLDCDGDGDLDMLRVAGYWETIDATQPVQACEHDKNAGTLTCGHKFLCLGTNLSNFHHGRGGAFARFGSLQSLDLVNVSDGRLQLAAMHSNKHNPVLWKAGFCTPSSPCHGKGFCNKKHQHCQCLKGYELKDCSQCERSYHGVFQNVWQMRECKPCPESDGHLCHGRGECFDDAQAPRDSTALLVAGNGSCRCHEAAYFTGTDLEGRKTCSEGSCPGGSEETDGRCHPCDGGWFSAAGSSCTPCRPGSYSSSAGSSSCQVCPPGLKAPKAGLTACEPCSAGFFSGQGFSSCSPCPSGSVSDPGSSSCRQCNDDGNFFRGVSDELNQNCQVDSVEILLMALSTVAATCFCLSCSSREELRGARLPLAAASVHGGLVDAWFFDVNGGECCDVLRASSRYENVTDPVFVPGYSYYANTSKDLLRFVDWDGDGDADILLGTYQQNSFRILFHERISDDSFLTQELVTLEGLHRKRAISKNWFFFHPDEIRDSLWGWTHVAAAYRSNSSTVEGFQVADWDGDGRLDLLLCMQGPTVSNITFLNRALLPVNSIENGSLILSTSSVRQDTLCDMEPVDFDEDGVVDLFLGGFTRYFQRQSTDSDLIEQTNPLGIYNGSVLKVFDFDADGQLELLLDAFPPNDRNEMVTFRWLRRALDGSFVESEENPFALVLLKNQGHARSWIEEMYLTDWNSDGLPDLLVVEFFERGNGMSSVFRPDWYRQVRNRDMIYNSHFTAFEEIPANSNDEISVLDWNQDGFDDHVSITSYNAQLYEISDAGARPGEKLVMTANLSHFLLKHSPKVTFKGTENPSLDQLPWTVHKLNSLQLTLRGVSQLNQVDTSMGHLIFQFPWAFTHTGLLRCPLIFWCLLFGAASAAATTRLTGSAILLVIVVGICAGFLAFAWRCRLSHRTPISKRRRQFLKEWPLPRQPCERGPDRSMTAGQLQDFVQFFDAFIKERSMYYVCSNIVKPLTKPFQLSFVELIGPSTMEWFVSHYWGMAVRHFNDAIRKHAMSYATEWRGLAYWICTFSNSQWHVSDELGYGAWQELEALIEHMPGGFDAMNRFVRETICRALARSHEQYELTFQGGRDSSGKHIRSSSDLIGAADIQRLLDEAKELQSDATHAVLDPDGRLSLPLSSQPKKDLEQVAAVDTSSDEEPSQPQVVPPALSEGSCAEVETPPPTRQPEADQRRTPKKTKKVKGSRCDDRLFRCGMGACHELVVEQSPTHVGSGGRA
eukprot:Skav215555  [mRNA]  locus=scaffold3091:212800:237229:- [translate_table: standard]